MIVISPERFAAATIAALRLKFPNDETVPYGSTGIDEYFSKIADRVLKQVQRETYVFNFSFKQDRRHRDSQELRDALSILARTGLISIDNPSFRTLRLKLSKEQSKHILEDFVLGDLVQDAVLKEQMELFDAS